ncbi:MAG: hypothetical protein Q9227_005299 [Pyrenula ochraceoflavens]
MPAGLRTNTYLLNPTNSSSPLLLIDTGQGFPSWSQHLSSHLQTLNSTSSVSGSSPSSSPTISTALLTHWHHDHTHGIPSLLSLSPKTQIHKNSPDLNPNPPPPSSSPAKINPIEDGQFFPLGDANEGVGLRAHHTPGHTADHMCFILEAPGAEDDGAIFTGDSHGTAVFESLPLYMRTLTKMNHLIQPGVPAYPGHGAVIPDAKAKIEEYIQHRHEREKEVMTALRGGGVGRMTAMQIVKVVYKDVNVNLHEAAERGVKMVLGKLEGEGRVERVEGGKEEEERWRVVEGKGGVKEGSSSL